jgi:hypothetical protein
VKLYTFPAEIGASMAATVAGTFDNVGHRKAGTTWRKCGKIK